MLFRRSKLIWYGCQSQNENGPCSLIALCNILLLRDELHITPEDRPAVSYEYLSALLADHLLGAISARPPTDAGALDLGAALSILPRTQRGLDVNMRFGAHDAFATEEGGALPPNGEGRNGQGELALFKLCGVPLVHGWLADPADQETYDAVMAAGDYDR